MNRNKLPDVTSKFIDFGLARGRRIKSGIFVLIGHSQAKEEIIKITSQRQAENLGFSTLKDTVLDFFSNTSGTVYCFPINLATGKTTWSTEKKPNNINLTVSAEGVLYKSMKFVVEVVTPGATNTATFKIKYEGSETAPQTINNKKVEIKELGISLTVNVTSGQQVKTGDRVIVTAKTNFEWEDSKIEKAHKAILTIDDFVEYIAYDIDSTTANWTFTNKFFEEASEKYKKDYFGVFRFRNLQTNEKLEINEQPPAYITALKSAKTGFTSIRTLVVGQPLTYKNYFGLKRVGKIPFGYFLSILSGTRYFDSLSAVSPENMIPGIVTLEPFTLDDINKIYELGYTGFRHFEGFKGTYISEAMLMSDEKSDYDSVERIRIMNRASFVSRNALVGSFLNRNFALKVASKDPALPILVEEIIKKAFDNHLSGAITEYEVSVDGFEDIVETNEIRINYRIVPLSKIRYITNTFSYALAS